jgi:ABC-type Fe3+-siderophore transport system permease subunit
LIASAAAGALLMVTADWIGRLVLFPNELPVGLTAALIGGPYLIWTLVRPDGVGAAR